MDLRTRIHWVYSLHDTLVSWQENAHATCPRCAFFGDHRNFNSAEVVNMSLPQLLGHFNWELCEDHLGIFEDFLNTIEGYFFETEHELGIFEEGYFRHLPDGELCSLRTTVWRDHLLSLAE